MTVQIIKATIDSVRRKNAPSNGEPGVSIVLNYDDGSTWPDGKKKGKLIFQWLWCGDSLRENQKDDIRAWAALADPGCDLDTAKRIVAGESWILFGTIVDLQVNQEGKFWEIINFGPEESLHQAAKAAPTKDDVPF